MADNNTITSNDFAAQNIDFVNRFNQSNAKLLELLSISRIETLNVGDTYDIYEDTVIQGGAQPAEGEEIPLSKVTHKKTKTERLSYTYLRDEVSKQAIQSNKMGIGAVAYADNKLLMQATQSIKKSFIAKTLDGTNKVNATGFQDAIAKALGQLAVKWEDYDTSSVVFVNPVDYYNYAGGQNITIQDELGIKYLTNFLGADKVILAADIPAGTITATVADNIVYAQGVAKNPYDSNEYSDGTGLVTISHTSINSRQVVETVIAYANAIFFEALDGVVVATIKAPADNSKTTPATTPSK